jgi:hypothetical protein
MKYSNKSFLKLQQVWLSAAIIVVVLIVATAIIFYKH